ncbi:hypothetical protein R3P38DRAFT_2803700 [Favolaschia claudopus]|uniref:Uncharacterized protein n=1 Tax=Favolaschia claudopus TaxID=2862362 RepID=A0AAV9ZS43_9AGAR
MFVWRTKAGEGLRKRLRQALADVGRLVENSDKTPVWLRPGSNSDKNAPIWGPDKIAQNPESCGQASQLVAGGPEFGNFVAPSTTVENAKSPATIARPAVRRPKNLKLPLASALKADAPSAVSMGTIVSHALMSFEGDIRQARPVEEKGLGTVTQIS